MRLLRLPGWRRRQPPIETVMCVPVRQLVTRGCGMSGDSQTLCWRSMPPTNQDGSLKISSMAIEGKENISQVKIIKVCFLSNSSNMGKNFKLVRCEEGWTVKVHCATTLQIFPSPSSTTNLNPSNDLQFGGFIHLYPLKFKVTTTFYFTAPFERV